MTPDVAEQQLRLRARVSNAQVEKTTYMYECLSEQALNTAP
jgi:hypothetical protein